MIGLRAAALGAGIVLASCSSHASNAIVPQGPAGLAHAVTTSSFGTHSMVAPNVATAPAGWTTTGTQAFTLANASDLGALSPSTPVTVRVALQLRNVDQLKSAVAARQRLDPATLAATYNPTSAQVGLVTSYLGSKGFSNVTVDANNLLVSATATAGQVAQAFDTTLHSFSQNGRNVYANTSPAYVPQSLSGIVVAVLGLSNAPTMKAAPRQQATPCNVEGVATPSQACLRFYDPATFQIAYDATSVPDGSSTTVAIMTEGDVTQSISDLRLNEQNFNLPQVPVNVIKVGLSSTDTSGDGEWTLDTAYSSGIAGNLKALDLYNTTSLTDSDITLMYNAWVTQDLAPIGNSSFGGCEYAPFLDGSMLAIDEIMLEGAAQGQTMFVSSGDSGGFCGVAGAGANGVPAGAPMVEYPASSPYVVAVGGTDLFSNADGTYLGEQSWEAGGGGVSQFEYSPYWETTEQPVSQNVSSMRGVPDIAMDAAIETGALTWGGQAANGACTPCVTGGTSLASPLAAGSYARMQSAHGNTLGFLPPLLYQNYVENAAGAPNTGPPAWEPRGGFHDIIVGSNVSFQALPGYDYTTGLGSFDIGAMNAQIGK
jgi:subtilase family serine protease